MITVDVLAPNEVAQQIIEIWNHELLDNEASDLLPFVVNQ
jgi:hypothetical protein